MNAILFTAASCARCNIAKKYMQEKGLAYHEYDINGDGKDLFGDFYRAHRNLIFRGRDGIEFPILADSASIRQGVAAVLAYLQQGTKLDGFIGQSGGIKGWIDGLPISNGNPAYVDELVTLLGFLKKNGLKLQLDTHGKNASVLRTLFEKGLGDRVVMELKGPRHLYGLLLGEEIDPAEVERTLEQVIRFPDYRFETTVAPFLQPDGIPRFPTPEEIQETAKWLKERTGSHKQPYRLRAFHKETCSDERLNSFHELPADALYRYRTAARKYQVLTELSNPPPEVSGC